MTEFQFQTVFRGYDPAEVERTVHTLKAGQAAALQDAAQKAVEITKLQTARDSLAHDLAEMRDQLERLEQNPPQSAPASYASLGSRIVQILTLVEEEVAEVRSKAAEEVTSLRAEVAQETADQRDSASIYATEVKSKADAQAAKIIELAKRDADDIIDHSEREASARRGEAEALYESQRAKSAAAAADFEKTLAARRDKAQEEFQQQMAGYDEAIRAAEENLAARRSEALQVLEEATTEAQQIRESAELQANHLLETARANAERVRRDSERELVALASRRDSITGQLANVRQMLATLSGGTSISVSSDQPVDKAVTELNDLGTEPEAIDEIHASEQAEATTKTANFPSDDADQVEVKQLAVEGEEVAAGLRPAESVE